MLQIIVNKDIENQGNDFPCQHLNHKVIFLLFILLQTSSSKSPSPRQSSPEREINRKRSLSPHDKKQQSDAAPQNETTKGDTVRKWKIRKQLPTAEADTAETEAPKKRRWGTSQLLPTKKPALVISTDSLKVLQILNFSVFEYALIEKTSFQTLVPDAKPLSAEEVRLGSPNFQPPVKPTVNQTPESEDHQLPAADKIAKVENVRRVAVEMAVEAFAPAKPEAVMAAAAPLLEATSPAQQPRSSVLNVSNLVRPFTINQLKELLARTGHLVEGKFWIDRVKSSCLVQVGLQSFVMKPSEISFFFAVFSMQQKTKLKKLGLPYMESIGLHQIPKLF